MSTVQHVDVAALGMIDGVNERRFTLFNKLPIELRLMIYGMALPKGRVHHLVRKDLKMTVGAWEKENYATSREDIFVAAGFDYPHERYWDERRIYKNNNIVKSPVGGPDAIPLIGFKSYLEAPALLFVCRESHEYASKYYQPAFAAFGSVPETYFDFEEDTLLLRSDTFGVEPEEKGDFLYYDSYEKYYRGLLGLWGLNGNDDLFQVKHLAVEVRVEEFREEDDAECFISNLLTDFQDLDTLTLVVEHYQGSGTDLSTFSLMNPINLTAFQDQYKAITDQINQTPKSSGSYKLPSVDDFPHEHFKLAKDLRMRFIEECSVDILPFRIPQITCKVSLTQEYGDDLDKLLTEGQALVEEMDTMVSTIDELTLDTAKTT